MKNGASWEKAFQQFVKVRRFMEDHILEHSTNSMTPIEKKAFIELFMLVEHVGHINLILRWQVPVGKYRADFILIYQPIESSVPLKKIVIECDGHDFHEKTKKQAARDKERDRFFAKEGYIVLRYTGSEIYSDSSKIHHDVMELIIPDHRKADFGYGPEAEALMREMARG